MNAGILHRRKRLTLAAGVTSAYVLQIRPIRRR
jgi:hypothetical protein